MFSLANETNRIYILISVVISIIKIRFEKKKKDNSVFTKISIEKFRDIQLLRTVRRFHMAVKVACSFGSEGCTQVVQASFRFNFNS